MALGKGLESLIPKKNFDKTAENAENIFDGNLQVRQPADSAQTDFPQSRETIKQESEEKAVNQVSVSANNDKTAEIASNRRTEKNSSNEAVFLIEIDKIKSNPYQPRRTFNEDSLKELAASIREVGILQPLLVTKIESETEIGTEVSYQLIAGERRFMAAKMLGMERVPAIIKKVNLENNRLEIAIIENLQRANLNPLEEARAFAKLQDSFGLTQREIAQKIGKSREAVANTIRLLNLPSNIQESLEQNKISESQGRMLLAISDLGHQQKMFQELIGQNLSVRDLKEKIEEGKISPSAGGAAAEADKIYLENQLEEILGAKVQINKTQKGGKIVIKFFSPEELNFIVKKICQE